MRPHVGACACVSVREHVAAQERKLCMPQGKGGFNKRKRQMNVSSLRECAVLVLRKLWDFHQSTECASVISVGEQKRCTRNGALIGFSVRASPNNPCHRGKEAAVRARGYQPGYHPATPVVVKGDGRYKPKYQHSLLATHSTWVDGSVRLDGVGDGRARAPRPGPSHFPAQAADLEDGG
jgi:hypothetical protein